MPLAPKRLIVFDFGVGRQIPLGRILDFLIKMKVQEPKLERFRNSFPGREFLVQRRFGGILLTGYTSDTGPRSLDYFPKGWRNEY